MPIPNLPLPMLAGGALAGMLGSAIVMAIIAAIVGDVPVVKLVAYVLIGVVGAMAVSMVIGTIVAMVLWPATMVFWNVSRTAIKRGK